MFCGIIFSISGTFGIWAGFQSSRCTIIAHLVFAIISTFFCVPLIFHSIAAIVLNENDGWYHYRTSWNYEHSSTSDKFKTDKKISLAVCIIQAIVGLLQAGFAIASSGLSCNVICCRERSRFEDDERFLTTETKTLVMTRKPVIWMSTIQIIAAIIAIFLNVAGIVYPYDGYAFVGIGIWSAVPFVLCGSFGILSGLSPSKCSVISFMVLSIIATFFSVPFLGLSIIGFVTSSDAMAKEYQTPQLPLKANWNWVNGSVWQPNYDDRKYQNLVEEHNLMVQEKETERKVTFWVFLTQTIIALIQLIISVNSSAMACQPICCPTNTARPHIPDERTTEINHIQVQDFKPRKMPNSSSIPEEPFAYKSPDELIYLSSTHASIGGG